MNVRRAILAALLAALLPCAGALAQGFGGLGSDAKGFMTPRRGHVLSFPRDDGAHPGFRIEWWYVTANLRGEDGRDYGVQWTLFRSALAPPGQDGKDGWAAPVIWMGNAALTTPQRQFSAERLARGKTGQAGAIARPFEVWIDEWRLAGRWPDLSLRASAPDFAYDLSLTQTGPRVLNGDKGYSVKSPEGQASYYYSYPFLSVRGVLRLPEGAVKVTGQAWIDREWSSQPLSEGQSGWDWISLHLADGSKLMGFQTRAAKGGTFTSATWIAPDGTATALPDGQLVMTPLDISRVAGRDIPTRWRVQLASRGLDVTIEALNRQSWMPMRLPYWEGPVSVSGSIGGAGYLEMTGYE